MLSEKIALVSVFLLALALTIGGVSLALRSGDHHWMNRAGAAIVASEGCVGLIEFRRRSRLERVRREFQRRITSDEARKRAQARHRFLRDELERAEFRVLLSALVLAVYGELLHGFGDLIFHN